MKNYMKILSAVLFMLGYNTDNCSAEQVNSTTNQDQNNQIITDIVNGIQNNRKEQGVEQGQSTGKYNNFISGLAKSPLIGNAVQQVQNSTEAPTLPLSQTPVINDTPQQIQNNTEQLPTIGNIITDTNQLSTIGTMITGDNTRQQTNAFSTTGIQDGNVEQPQNLEQMITDTSTLPSLTNDFSAGTIPVLPSLPTEQLSTLAQSLTGDTNTETNHVPEQMQTVNNTITDTEVMPTLGNVITAPTTTEVPNETQTAHGTQQDYNSFVSGLTKSPLIGNAIQQVQNSTEMTPGLGQQLTPVQTNNTQSTDILNTTSVSDPTTGIGQSPTISQSSLNINSQQVQSNTGQLPTLGNITTGTEPLTTLGNMI